MSLKQLVEEALQKKDFAAAEQICKTYEDKADPLDLLLVRSVVLAAEGRIEPALNFLKEAFQKQPARSDIAYNYGVLLHQMGRQDEALKAWQQAIEVDPSCLWAWQNAGTALIAKGVTKEVGTFYQKALSHHPKDRLLRLSYGMLCLDLNRWDEACEVYDGLVKDYPEDSAVLINAGKIYKTAGLYDRAEKTYQRALALKDRWVQGAFNYATLLLLQGQWKNGFSFYEARQFLPHAMKTPWNLPPFQENLAKGKHILLWNDQGLGDALMFARFIPAFRDKGYKVSLFVQQPLKRLMASFEGIEAVFEPLDNPQKLDAALPLSSLPFMLKIEEGPFYEGPYLKAPSEVLPFLNDITPPKIGLVWAGSSTHYNDKNRSMRFDDFKPLFQMQNLDWYSLQKDVTTNITFPCTDLAPHLTDLAVTAAVVAKLDLVICVDTAIAHLAGAMGKPALVLLPMVGTDWRWGLAEEQNQWYPSIRLFRQSKPGDWQDVMMSVKKHLQVLYG